MLLFITLEVTTVRQAVSFQYITCYSLSSCGHLLCLLGRSFNTSHVTLYRLSGRKTHFVNSVSIHHMLLFINKATGGIFAHMLFQYITCYSLSDENSKLITMPMGFNTSHVTLYRFQRNQIT